MIFYNKKGFFFLDIIIALSLISFGVFICISPIKNFFFRVDTIVKTSSIFQQISCLRITALFSDVSKTVYTESFFDVFGYEEIQGTHSSGIGFTSKGTPRYPTSLYLKDSPYKISTPIGIGTIRINGYTMK
jgi:hypothetical protein